MSPNLQEDRSRLVSWIGSATKYESACLPQANRDLSISPASQEVVGHSAVGNGVKSGIDDPGGSRALASGGGQCAHRLSSSTKAHGRRSPHRFGMVSRLSVFVTRN